MCAAQQSISTPHIEASGPSVCRCAVCKPADHSLPLLHRRAPGPAGRRKDLCVPWLGLFTHAQLQHGGDGHSKQARTPQSKPTAGAKASSAGPHAKTQGTYIMVLRLKAPRWLPAVHSSSALACSCTSRLWACRQPNSARRRSSAALKLSAAASCCRCCSCCSLRVVASFACLSTCCRFQAIRPSSSLLAAVGTWLLDASHSGACSVRCTLSMET